MTSQDQNSSQNLENPPLDIQTSGLRIGKCEELMSDSPYEWISKVVAVILIFVLCVALNSLVVVLVYKTKKMHKDMCYFIVNMALSDMLVMALGLEEWLTILFTYSRSWKVGGYLGIISCKIVNSLRFVTPIVSITTLIIISFERLRAVTSPLHVQPLRRPVFWCVVSLCWLFPTAVYGYILYAFDLINYKGDVYCIDVGIDRPGWVIYHYVFYAILIALFVLLVSLNLTIIKKLRASREAVSSLPEDQKKKRERNFVRAVAMVACCSGSFVVCWGPRNVLRFLDHLAILRFDFCVAKNFFFLIDVLFYLNFSFSPIIYFVFLKDFSDAMRQLGPWKK